MKKPIIIHTFRQLFFIWHIECLFIYIYIYNTFEKNDDNTFLFQTLLYIRDKIFKYLKPRSIYNNIKIKLTFSDKFRFFLSKNSPFLPKLGKFHIISRVLLIWRLCEAIF